MSSDMSWNEHSAPFLNMASATPYTDAAHLSLKKSRSHHVKRPMNAFIIWSQEERQRIAKYEPVVHHAEISKELGLRWKLLREEERQDYVARSKRLKQLHMSQYPNYKFAPRRQKASEKRSYTKKNSNTDESSILIEHSDHSSSTDTNPIPSKHLDLVNHNAIFVKSTAQPQTSCNDFNLPLNLESTPCKKKMIYIPKVLYPPRTGSDLENVSRFNAVNDLAKVNDKLLQVKGKTIPILVNLHKNIEGVDNKTQLNLHRSIENHMVMKGLRIIAPKEDHEFNKLQINVSPVLNASFVKGRRTNKSIESKMEIIDLTDVSSKKNDSYPRIDSFEENTMFIDEQPSSLCEDNSRCSGSKTQTDLNDFMMNEPVIVIPDESETLGIDLRMKSPSVNNDAGGKTISQVPLVEHRVARPTEKLTLDSPEFAINETRMTLPAEMEAFKNRVRNILRNDDENDVCKNEIVIDDSSLEMEANFGVETDHFLISVEGNRNIRASRPQEKLGFALSTVCPSLSSASPLPFQQRCATLTNAPEFIDIECVLDELIVNEYNYIKKNGLSFQLPAYAVSHALHENQTCSKRNVLNEFPDYMMEELRQVL